MPPEANLCSQGPPRPLLRGVLAQKSSNSGPKLTTFSIIPDPSHPSNPSSPSNPLHPIIQGSKHPSLQASKPPMASAGCAKRKQFTSGPYQAEMGVLGDGLSQPSSLPRLSPHPPRASEHSAELFRILFLPPEVAEKANREKSSKPRPPKTTFFHKFSDFSLTGVDFRYFWVPKWVSGVLF